MSYSVQIVIACDDPGLLTEFWAGALGYVAEPPPDGFETWEQFADIVGIPEENRNDLSAAIDPEGVGPRILFERYDGGVRNQRVHLDLNSVSDRDVELTDDERRARLSEERTRLELLGATFKREATGLAGEIWVEMFDPEGNWFCVQ